MIWALEQVNKRALEQFEQAFITWYLNISRKEALISFLKALNIFLLNSVMDSTKLESADSGCWINDIK